MLLDFTTFNLHRHQPEEQESIEREEQNGVDALQRPALHHHHEAETRTLSLPILQNADLPCLKKARGDSASASARTDFFQHLPPLLLNRIWPPDRVVMGLRVNKSLQTELAAATSEAVLSAAADAEQWTPTQILKTLYSLRRSRLLLRWESEAGRDALVAGVSAAVALGCTGCLAHLSLARTRLGPLRAATLFAALRSCRGIVSLNLADARVGEAAVEGLCGVLEGAGGSLSHLSLRDNRLLGDGGGARVAETLRVCGSLRHLDLSNCGIGGLAVRELAGALEGCEGLEELLLADNGIRGAGAGALARGLAGCRGLRRLELGENEVGDRGVVAVAEAVRGLTRMTHLDLGGVGMEAGGLRAVAEVAGGLPLEVLSVSGAQGGEGAGEVGRRLGACRGLQHLDLSNCGGLEDAGHMEGLGGCTGLTHLNVSGMGLGSEAGEALAGALGGMARLAVLDAYRNEFHVAQGAGGVGEAGGGAGRLAEAVGGCAGLRYLDVGQSGLCGGRLQLEGCGRLAVMCVDDLRLGAAGATALAGQLGGLPGLEELHMAHNGAGDAGAGAVAGAMAECRGLRKVDLSANSVGDAGARSVAEALPRCGALEWLGCHRNKIGDAGALALAGGVVQCRRLRGLTVSGNAMGRGSEAMLAALVAGEKVQVESEGARLRVCAAAARRGDDAGAESDGSSDGA